MAREAIEVDREAAEELKRLAALGHTTVSDVIRELIVKKKAERSSTARFVKVKPPRPLPKSIIFTRGPRCEGASRRLIEDRRKGF